MVNVVAQEVPVEESVVEVVVSVAALVVPAASVAAQVEIVEVIVLTTKNHVAT